MLGCDTEAYANEAYANVMFYHFEEGISKPYCQQIMGFCINQHYSVIRRVYEHHNLDCDEEN